MTTASVSWLFICSKHEMWTWRSAYSAARIDFHSLDEATADATSYGFDPFVHYWTANRSGRTTHFRPGMAPINVSSEIEP